MTRKVLLNELLPPPGDDASAGNAKSHAFHQLQDLIESQNHTIALLTARLEAAPPLALARWAFPRRS